eukprot:sb/3471936/
MVKKSAEISIFGASKNRPKLLKLIFIPLRHIPDQFCYYVPTFTRFQGVDESSLMRLIGTQVILIGSSTNTTCGTIDSVSLDADLENQTYTVPCPATSEPTLAVFLYDNYKDSTENKGLVIIMRIVEVMIFTSADTAVQEPTETSKKTIRTSYLGDVTGYQQIRDHDFQIRSVPDC